MKMTSLLTRTVAPVMLVAGMAGLGAANAALVTTDAGYTGPFINLASRANGSYNFTYGPVALPGMTFTRDTTTASNSDTAGPGTGGAVLGQGGYGLASNGSYDGTPVYAGLDGSEGWMRFTLTGGPVSSFGAYVNYAPGVGPDPVIAVLAADNSVIEEWNLATFAPVVTPGGLNAFEFRGIELSTASIYALEFRNSYILATGTRTGVPPIPEPETYAMMLAGLGLLGFAARRRKSRIA